MFNLVIQPLREHPAQCHQAALWFSQKWGVPLAAYEESIRQCLAQQTGVPQWYLVLDDKAHILAGAGVIDNDFHNRQDLSPNLCALFVEERCRQQKIARKLLDFIRADFSAMGVEMLYLITDHADFYERCGWNFYTTVTGEDGEELRLYTATTTHLED